MNIPCYLFRRDFAYHEKQQSTLQYLSFSTSCFYSMKDSYQRRPIISSLKTDARQLSSFRVIATRNSGTTRVFIVSVALTLHPPAKDCVKAKRGQQPRGRPQRPRTAYWRSLMTVRSVGELRLGRSVAWSFCGRTYHQGTKKSGGSRSGGLLEEQSPISIFENWEKTHPTVSLNNDRSGQRINQAIENEWKTLGSSPMMRPIGT